MDTTPQAASDCADDSTNSSQSTSQSTHSDEEAEDDAGELPEEIDTLRESQPLELKIDVNALKNEILVDGMQV